MHFEVNFHKITSWTEVEEMVGIFTIPHEMTKIPLCQENSALEKVSIS